nr:redoxin domain-containing protein [uncultured Arsenicibacter sp.]
MLYEIENEGEEIRTIMLKDRTATHKLKPLVTGDKLPYLNLVNRTDDRDTSGVPGFFTSIDDLLDNQPLVIAFYSPNWGHYARPYLETLVRLSYGLKAVGANLLVFSDERAKIVARQAGPVDLLIAQDTRLSVARRFGLYSEDDPVWDRISGISDDVFLPAIYVVNPDRIITCHSIAEYFDRLPDPARIIDAVLELSPVV